VALAPADQRRQVGRGSPGGPALPRVFPASRAARATQVRGGAALAAHQAQRDGPRPPAHAANLGRHARELHRPDQRVAARMAPVLRDRLGRRATTDAQDRRPHPSTPASHPAAPPEASTNDRSSPRRAGVKPQSAWRAVYAGKKSTWALSHAPAVDHGLRNAYFTRRGLISLAKLHQVRRPPISAPAHPPWLLEQG
jgi:hypothetical protein